MEHAFPRGIESAVAQATTAAGNRAVQVVGAVHVTRQLLRVGLADERRMDVMPVFLGTGLRLLDSPELEHVRLSMIGVQEVGERTSLRLRVER